jgi:hypothetical protein
MSCKQDIVARGTAAEAHQLAGEIGQLLATRRAALGDQLAELLELRGKNEQVVEQMVVKVKAEKETYERGLREYYAVRSVFSQLSDALFAHLGMENLRSHARKTRETMRQARFTPQLTAAMGELFAAARQSLDASEQDLAEIATMMRAMHEKFGRAYGISIEPPPAFTLKKRRQELDDLEASFRRQFGGILNLLTLDKRTLTQQFFETIVLQLRKSFDHANRDTDYWLRAQMSPLENHVREVQRQLKHRLESVRRIHEAAESLEDRIDELTTAKATLAARLSELAELEAGLLAALNPPRQGSWQAAA